jgi:hypothetical protein
MSVEDNRPTIEEICGLSSLNNFCHLLPHPSFDGGCRYAAQALEQRIMDTPHGQHLTPQSEERKHHSQKYLERTPRQLYEDVSQAIAKVGISTRIIESLQESIYKAGSEHARHQILRSPDSIATPFLQKMIRYQDQLYVLTLPVYINLRLSGYWPYDLIA